MKNRMVRILMAQLGDGYDKTMLQLAKVFRDAGFEVIYTNVQEPETIVASALQESVDHIGITTLPGANINNLSIITELLTRQNASDIRVTAGGFIAEEDESRIKELGIVEFFPKGTTFTELVNWARENIKPIEL
ncbi:MAG: cobalamin-dependent protein [Syntrophobacterales bacterium]|nr:cobalamin-dependent protein [Syntrophobacterales bacterium]